MTFEEFYDRYIGFGEYLKNNLDSRPTTFGVFSVYHFVMTLIMTLFIIAFCYLTRKNNRVILEKKMRGIAWVMFVLELIRMSWFRTFRPDTYFIRFDWCNMVCLIMPICIILRLRKTYPFFMGAAFWGGAGVMVYPLWVFRDYGGFHLMSIQSMISHGLMLLTSITLMRLSPINLKRKKEIFLSITIGFSIMVVLALTFSLIRNVNYMAMLSPEGLPIIEKIKAPYHLLLIIPAEYAGFFVLAYVYSLFQKKFLANEREAISNDLQESCATV